MARRGKPATDLQDEAPRPAIKPLRVVRRELTSPGGKKVLVDVPVYPPFQLETHLRSRAGKSASVESPSSSKEYEEAVEEGEAEDATDEDEAEVAG